MPLVLFEPASIHAVGETVPKVGADVVGTKVVGANEGAAVIERVGDDVDTESLPLVDPLIDPLSTVEIVLGANVGAGTSTVPLVGAALMLVIRLGTAVGAVVGAKDGLRVTAVEVELDTPLTASHASVDVDGAAALIAERRAVEFFSTEPKLDVRVFSRSAWSAKEVSPRETWTVNDTVADADESSDRDRDSQPTMLPTTSPTVSLSPRARLELSAVSVEVSVEVPAALTVTPRMSEASIPSTTAATPTLMALKSSSVTLVALRPSIVIDATTLTVSEVVGARLGTTVGSDELVGVAVGLNDGAVE